MANVNLISARRSERVRMTRIARGLTGAVVASGLAGLAGVGYLTTNLVLKQGEISRTEDELGRLRPILAEIEVAEQERVALQPKILTLIQAQQKTVRWFGIMEGFKQAVPTETWLTNVSVEKSGESGKVLRINGVTVSQSRVGETMYRLTQQKDKYAKVDLRFTQTTPTQDKHSVEFELAAHLSQPGHPEAAGGANETQTR
jgi:Tfp pilus assembly protein PilN